MFTAETWNRIRCIQADITRLKCDAIVNAANESLLGGGGVDGAIHRAAGPDLLAECRTLHGCPTGGAKITRGYRLPAKYVIHTVGPVYRGGRSGESSLLKSCYENSLAIARDHGIRTMAFPAISCGVYGYPIESAAQIALTTVAEFLKANALPEDVVFALFSESDLQVYNNAIVRLKGE